MPLCHPRQPEPTPCHAVPYPGPGTFSLQPTFSGLMSRWMMRLAWHCATVRSTARRKEAAVRSLYRRFVAATSSPPEHSSSTWPEGWAGNDGLGVCGAQASQGVIACPTAGLPSWRPPQQAGQGRVHAAGNVF